MSDLQTLQDMGFPSDRAEYALRATSYKGVEQAMEWLLAHEDEALPAAAASSTGGASDSQVSTNAPDEAAATAAAASSDTAESTSSEAKSLRCDECNRLFKNQLEVEFHAAKSGHSKFSESTEEKKALTAEEKAAQMVLLEEKLKLKRQAREAEEKAEALTRERIRIKQGKEMVEAKRKVEEQEMAKIVEARRREKEEEKLARDRVRLQIEADKAARKAKMGGGGAGNGNGEAVASSVLASPTVSTTTPATSSSAAGTTKEYTHTRIQFRLPDGSAVTEQFNVKENLAAVRLFVQINHYPDLPFRLMTAYPKKVFQEDDYEKPLNALGLVPSSVIIVSKAV